VAADARDGRGVLARVRDADDDREQRPRLDPVRPGFVFKSKSPVRVYYGVAQFLPMRARCRAYACLSAQRGACVPLGVCARRPQKGTGG
jgi:hypothetical protein